MVRLGAVEVGLEDGVSVAAHSVQRGHIEMIASSQQMEYTFEVSTAWAVFLVEEGRGHEYE